MKKTFILSALVLTTFVMLNLPAQGAIAPPSDCEWVAVIEADHATCGPDQRYRISASTEAYCNQAVQNHMNNMNNSDLFSNVELIQACTPVGLCPVEHEPDGRTSAS